MALLRTVLTLMLAGALLGGVIAGWMAPKYLEWNTTSPYATTTQCDLPAVVRQVAADILKSQAVGGDILASIQAIPTVTASQAKENAEKAKALKASTDDLKNVKAQQDEDPPPMRDEEPTRDDSTSTKTSKGSDSKGSEEPEDSL